MKTRSIAQLLFLLCASARISLGGELSGESGAVANVIETFHNALSHGDGKTAIGLLTSDAVILESGSLETRAEYEAHHLQEDIQFAQATHSLRSDVRVEIDGKTAWLTSRSRTDGSFEGKPVNSSGVELAILTKTVEGWRIRAIHWSTHRVASGK